MRMPTCREVTHAVAGEELAQSPWQRRLLVRLHLLMCRHCRRYAAQMRTIGEAARELATSPTGEGESVERLRRLILRRLDAAH